MPRRPPLASLRAFEAAARHASFSAAAAELNLTPAAVSQQIRVLEAHLDAALFERLPRGVRLTERGAAYARPIRKAFADMNGATEALFGRARRRLNVRASISCAALVIAPRLFEFQSLRPDIDVRLSTFVWADQFDDDATDLDIRFGHGDWTDGLATHLGHETALPVCNPDYAASLGRPVSLATLAAGPLIEIGGSETDWTAIAEHGGIALPRPSSVRRVDSSLVALQMAISGPGAVIVLESFAREYMRLGLLAAPCAERLPIQPSHFIVERAGPRASEPARAFAEWVTSLY